MEITNLVTSPFGIGEKLILELLERGETVHTVFPNPKDVPMSLLGKAHLKYGFVKLDQETNIEKGLPRKADNIFHIYDLYSGPIPKMMMANTMVTVQLLDWAKRVGALRFVYLSTGEVYGMGKNIAESTPYNPRSFYATTKFQSEIIFRYYSRILNIKSIRVFFPFGRGVNQGYIHGLIESVKSGNSVETEYCMVSPTFIDDIIEPLIKARDIENSAGFNLCGSPLSVEEVIKTIETVTGKTARKVSVGKTELSGNNSQARETLGYKETPLVQAVKATFIG